MKLNDVDEMRQALEAINHLVDSDFAFDLDCWGLDKDGVLLPVADRRCDLKLLAYAQRVIGDIYCITHTEVGTCTAPHEDWRKIKHKILAAPHEPPDSSEAVEKLIDAERAEERA